MDFVFHSKTQRHVHLVALQHFFQICFDLLMICIRSIYDLLASDHVCDLDLCV